MGRNGVIQREAQSDGACTEYRPGDTAYRPGDTAYRPRIATYGGPQLKPYSLRNSNSDRHSTLRRSNSLSNSTSRVGVFSSTDSLFSSFLPPKLHHVALHHVALHDGQGNGQLLKLNNSGDVDANNGVARHKDVLADNTAVTSHGGAVP